jgi:hypothetical protein
MPISAYSAGTNEPVCARIEMSAFWRRNVLLPAIFGLVMSLESDDDDDDEEEELLIGVRVFQTQSRSKAALYHRQNSHWA